MKQGQINVQTENIFPIIKKFLYSDHEIFLRELVSNAVDATQKLKTLAALGKFKEELGDLKVEVVLDKKKKTITIKDNGIGMTEAEVEKYINEIAFSGAEEFVKKFKSKSETEMNALIGHFGLGFYSSFMVSDKVEIITKSHQKTSKAVHWECDGSPNYSMEESTRKERGTDIILHISKESADYLEEYKIQELLKKYCKFLPVPIVYGTEKITKEIEGEKDDKGNPKTEEIEQPRIINNSSPAWTKKPSELDDEAYKKFYRELYPMNFDEPLFNIHLNVDYPFNLTGILYFPKVKKSFEVTRDKIQLYCNQVFVTDSVEGIVPDFLMLLHGVIDSPDIPLNVSRSYLQSDPNVKKISSHIAKKVAEKLEELFKNDRADYEKKWDDIRIFIEYGMLSDDKFAEKAEKFCLLKNTDGKYYTFDEYNELIKETQKDKNKQLVYLYASDVQEQYSYISQAKDHGYDVLLMNGPLSGHFVQHLERKFKDCQFKRVDADVVDKLIEKDETSVSKLTQEEQDALKPVYEEVVDDKKFTVLFESLSEKDMPVMITQPEFMRRMKEMQEVGGMGFMGDMPMSYNMVVNANHPLTGKILSEQDEAAKKQLIKQATDLALLSQGMLKGEQLTDFIKRSAAMM